MSKTQTAPLSERLVFPANFRDVTLERRGIMVLVGTDRRTGEADATRARDNPPS
jgi:hypothetical protein